MAQTVIDQQRPAHPLTTEKAASAGKSTILVLVAITVVSLVVCVVSFATRHIDAGVSAASICLLAAGASLAYRSAELRRVRQRQRDGHSVTP
jgi:hypothetical protein